MKILKILLICVTLCTLLGNVHRVIAASDTSVYELNVPYYNQYDAGTPMGCEAASLLQALHYKDCAKEYDLKSFLKVMPYSKNDNPYEGYSGTPYEYLPYPTYQSIFPKPLTQWANQYGEAEDLSGKSETELQNEIKAGNPVIVYMSYNFEEPEWNEYPWGIGMDNMHVMTLCGYDGVNDKYQVCDPVKGKYWVKATTFTKSYNYLKWAVVVRTLRFNDVTKDKWYYEYVREASELGLMTGLDNGNFGPDKAMNRGMVSIVFHRIEGEQQVPYANIFSDVYNNQYYTTAVMWAKETGIITGYASGVFKPLNNVTREEMATMIYRFASYKGVNISSTKDITYFSDYNKISDYAKDALMWCVDNGIMSGKDNGTRLDPLGTATRAECAKMLVQAYKVIYNK